MLRVEILLQVVNLVADSSVEELARISPHRSPPQMVFVTAELNVQRFFSLRRRSAAP